MGKFKIIDGHKICAKCLVRKPVDDFPTNGPNRIYAYCKPCKKAVAKEHSLKRTSEYNRDANLKAKFGMNHGDYLEMLEAQGGVCKICGTTPEGKPLCVDHNHSTGEIRGLLCNHCNTGIGMLKDSVENLENAIRYLKRGQ